MFSNNGVAVGRMSSDVFFTVITATYNAAATLPRLLDSLAAQTCRDFELLVQDGASRDETLAILERHRTSLPALSVASEADSGIYDAWNRALARVRGEWVIFLGADDMLVDEGVLAAVKERLARVPETILFASGDVVVCDGAQDIAVQRGLDEGAPERLRAGEPAVHSGLFQRARVFAAGGFDTAYRITGDHDFVIRCWRNASDGMRLGLPVTRMGVGGATSSLRNVLRFRYEFALVMGRRFGLKGMWPHIPAVLKGTLPYLFYRLLGPERALALYGKLRELRNLPPASLR